MPTFSFSLLTTSTVMHVRSCLELTLACYFLPFFGFSTCATLIFFAATALRTIT